MQFSFPFLWLLFWSAWCAALIRQNTLLNAIPIEYEFQYHSLKSSTIFSQLFSVRWKVRRMGSIQAMSKTRNENQNLIFFSLLSFKFFSEFADTKQKTLSISSNIQFWQSSPYSEQISELNTEDTAYQPIRYFILQFLDFSPAHQHCGHVCVFVIEFDWSIDWSMSFLFSIFSTGRIKVYIQVFFLTAIICGIFWSIWSTL